MSLDDMLSPNCISNAIKILSQDSKIVFSANTGHYEIDEHGVRITPDLYSSAAIEKIEKPQDLLDKEYETLGTFYIQGQVFRKSAIDAAGRFDDTMTGDDIVLRTRIFRHMIDHPELKFSIGTDIVFAYRKHTGNLHKRTFRQIRTIIEWKEKYFPDQPYPELFYRWLEGFFSQCLKKGLDDELQFALKYSPIIHDHYIRYKRNWKFYRNSIKGLITRVTRTSVRKNI